MCIKSPGAVSTSLISNSCLLLIPGGCSACEACQYAYKLVCTNRKRKGPQEAELVDSSEERINTTKPRTSEEKEGGELRDELLSFEKGDTDDLLVKAE